MIFEIKTNNKLNVNKLLTSLIVPLMILSAILAETIFKSLQILSELLLLITFLILILKRGIDKNDLYILFIYFSINIISILYLNPTAVMLNIKQFGLPVFALIYFRKKTYSSIFLFLAFMACISLMVLQKINGYYPLPISQYITTLKDDLEGRPLGLFLNYHFSAFFVAVFLIGLTYEVRFYFIDYFILFLFGVQTSLLSYIGQKILNIYSKKRNNISLKKLIIWFLIILISILFLIRAILFLLDVPEGAISGLVIFYQLTDLQTYVRLFDFFPRDIYEFYKQDLYDYSDTKVNGYSATGNEISFIQINVQGGIILGLSFLYFILKNISMYRLFILLSLIHYSYMFSPLIIYTMCYFENKNQILNE